MEKLRLFFAVHISENIRETLLQFQEKCRASGGHVKWVEKENLHMTLKFLGDTPQSKIEELMRSANAVAARFKPFTLLWSGFGAFPGLKSPKVIWAGLAVGGDLLESLFLALEQHLTAEGFPAETKKFKPHLTIGRVKSPHGSGELMKVIEKIKTASIGEMRVDFFSLISSTLTPSGPLYKDIGTFHLSGT